MVESSLVHLRGEAYGGLTAGGAFGPGLFWRVPALRPVPGPAGPAPGKRRGPAAAGQRVGQPVPAVVPRAVCLSAGLCPGGPPGCPGAGPALRRRGPVERTWPPWRPPSPLRLWQEEIPLGGAGGVGVLLLSGVALLPLAGWRGLFQPSHLWGHEHAPELPHQPGKPGGLPPGLLPAARRAALLSFSVGQHLRQPVPAGGAPVVCLPASHVGGGGPGAFWNLRLFRPDGP